MAGKLMLYFFRRLRACANSQEYVEHLTWKKSQQRK